MKRKNDVQNFNYNCLDANKSYFYVVALGVALSIVFAFSIILASTFSGMSYNDVVDTRIVSYIRIIITPILYLTFFVIYHKRHNIVIWRKTKINVVYLMVSIVFAGICIFGIAPITNWICIAFERLGADMGGDLTYTMNNWWQIVLGIVGYAILPALAEELIYRRIILEGFLTKHTARNAIIMTAIMFTIMHGSLQQFVYQLVLGVVLTLLAYATQSSIYSFVMHMLNNLLVVILSVTGADYLVSGSALPISTAGNILLYLLFAIVSLCVIAVVLRLIAKHNTLKSEHDNIINKGFVAFKSNQTQQENVYFTLGIAIAALVWIVNTISIFV